MRKSQKKRRLTVNGLFLAVEVEDTEAVEVDKDVEALVDVVEEALPESSTTVEERGISLGTVGQTERVHM